MANQITIAVTVYNRRQYLSQAIESALNQTCPVQVIVVEDCGPDAGLQSSVMEQFGSRILYFRNPRRRGLFDNLNACTEWCHTPWLSILPDDDFLAPDFVEAMIELSQKAPGCGLYFGETMVVDSDGRDIDIMDEPLQADWRPVEARLFVDRNLIGFPGQLFHVGQARKEGGFRATSLFCGDWELWAKLTSRSGAAQIGRPTGYLRHHPGWERGTNKVARSGKKHGLVLVQHKRSLALMRGAGMNGAFDRERFLAEQPMSARFMIVHAMFFPRRLLAYNCKLLAASKPPHGRYAAFQWLARTLGPRFVWLVSLIWNRCVRMSPAPNRRYLVKRQDTPAKG